MVLDMSNGVMGKCILKEDLLAKNNHGCMLIENKMSSSAYTSIVISTQVMNQIYFEKIYIIINRRKQNNI